jgi:Ras-related GTP-binding protein A/B
MELKNSNYTAFIDLFTTNTYILVISSDPDIYSSATLLNIRNARTHFEKFIASSTNL